MGTHLFGSPCTFQAEHNLWNCRRIVAQHTGKSYVQAINLSRQLEIQIDIYFHKLKECRSTNYLLLKCRVFVGCIFLFVLHVCFMLACAGLLTVDPKERLKINDLLNDPWMQGACAPSTPLLSPNVLSPGPRLPTAFNATLKAFHMASKEGFQLSSVTNAPLAQRRSRKRTRKRSASTGSDTRSSSGSSESVVITSAGTPSATISTCSTPSTPVLSPAVELAEIVVPADPSPSSAKRRRCSSDGDAIPTQPVSSARKCSLHSEVAANVSGLRCPDAPSSCSDLESFDNQTSTPSLSRETSSSMGDSGYRTFTESESSPSCVEVKQVGSSTSTAAKFHDHRPDVSVIKSVWWRRLNTSKRSIRPLIYRFFTFIYISSCSKFALKCALRLLTEQSTLLFCYCQSIICFVGRNLLFLFQ